MAYYNAYSDPHSTHILKFSIVNTRGSEHIFETFNHIYYSLKDILKNVAQMFGYSLVHVKPGFRDYEMLNIFSSK